jgi:hypothetical protein
MAYYMRGSQKVPRMVVLHCNDRTYGNVYLITFKVGPLCTYTLAPLILPSLEAPMEGFFWKLPESSSRIRFDVLHGCKACLHEARFQSRGQPKVTWSEIQGVWWLGDDRNVFLSKKLLHNKQCVAVCVIMMQKPLSLPLVVPLPLNCIIQPLQNLHIEMTSNTLSRQYELTVHKPLMSKNAMSITFSLDLMRCDFFGRGDDTVCHSDDCIFISGS